MDFFYAVKQLSHEIGIMEIQIAEKKAARDKLASLLSQQERILLEQEATAAAAPKKK